MPRIIAWILRSALLALTFLMIVYAFTAPFASAQRLGFRIFAGITLIVAVAVWEMTAPSTAGKSGGRLGDSDDA